MCDVDVTISAQMGFYLFRALVIQGVLSMLTLAFLRF